MEEVPVQGISLHNAMYDNTPNTVANPQPHNFHLPRRFKSGRSDYVGCDVVTVSEEDESPSLRCSGFGARSYPPKPSEFCTTSSAASGSSWPCLFRRALQI